MLVQELMLVSYGMQVFETMMLVLTSDGEEQEKAVKEFFERLSTLKEEIKNIFPEGIQVIDQKNVGLLDLVVVTTLSHYKAREECLGLKLIDPEMTPLLFSWLTALLELPLVKEALPTHEKVVGFLKYLRQETLKSTSA